MGERTFNIVLKELRTHRGLTQDELAAALHITKQALSHYERGTRYPKKEMLENIADYFNVDMNYLTGRSATTTTIRKEPEPQFQSFKLTDEELLVAMAYSRADATTKNGVRALLDLPITYVDTEVKMEDLPSIHQESGPIGRLIPMESQDSPERDVFVMSNEEFDELVKPNEDFDQYQYYTFQPSFRHHMSVPYYTGYRERRERLQDILRKEREKNAHREKT